MSAGGCAPAQTPILTVTLNPALDLATSVERMQPTVKLRCAAPSRDPGGGGVNVARVVRLLGGEVGAAVSLCGPTGAQLAALIEAAGIATLPLPCPGETRQSLAVTDRESGAQYRFVLPGPEWAADDADAALEALAGLAQRDGWMVLSGSNPPGVPADFAQRLAGRIAAAGGRLLVDTSGAALAAIASAGTRLAVLRMDRAEAEELAGQPLPSRDDTAALARDLVARGAAEVAVIARGGDGNILACAEGVWHAEALPVEIVSTVGAGDSFVGGLILGRARGGSWPEALGLAAACASAACMTPATELCRPEDVARLRAAGQITRMA